MTLIPRRRASASGKPATTPARLDAAAGRHRSLTADAWQRLRRNRLALFGLGVLILASVRFQKRLE